MPRYYCDYCDAYLTHDSASVRKTHNSGRKHKDNVRAYYQTWLDDNQAALIAAGVLNPATGFVGTVPPIGGLTGTNVPPTVTGVPSMPVPRDPNVGIMGVAPPGMQRPPFNMPQMMGQMGQMGGMRPPAGMMMPGMMMPPPGMMPGMMPPGMMPPGMMPPGMMAPPGGMGGPGGMAGAPQMNVAPQQQMQQQQRPPQQMQQMQQPPSQMGMGMGMNTSTPPPTQNGDASGGMGGGIHPSRLAAMQRAQMQRGM